MSSLYIICHISVKFSVLKVHHRFPTQDTIESKLNGAPSLLFNHRNSNKAVKINNLKLWKCASNLIRISVKNIRVIGESARVICFTDIGPKSVTSRALVVILESVLYIPLSFQEYFPLETSTAIFDQVTVKCLHQPANFP